MARRARVADTQTTIRLPDELRRAIQQAAERNQRGFGQEAAERLAASFVAEVRKTDAETTELLGTIAEAAGFLAHFWVPWHGSREAYTVFRDAVASILGMYRQGIPERRTPKTPQADLLIGTDDHAGERLALHSFLLMRRMQEDKEPMIEGWRPSEKEK